mmetsp:Transcript_115853/g.359941  ORF Transcript_115853/g.359941 Transcript_115853/m.359941 type:complete len:85 (-) Transcript_115853:760-1014(-)
MIFEPLFSRGPRGLECVRCRVFERLRLCVREWLRLCVWLRLCDLEALPIEDDLLEPRRESERERRLFLASSRAWVRTKRSTCVF